ncbi:MAG: hypothetical protein GEV06_27405 [Luteitalea sp.]|nr:hypothetical protein [Luteitalea sp.]
MACTHKNMRTWAVNGKLNLGMTAAPDTRSSGCPVSRSRLQVHEGAIGNMEHRDFVIGETFWTVEGQFRCTDIGARVVVAVKLGPREVTTVQTVDGEQRISRRIDDDSSWLNGPPYAVEEIVFDEDAQAVCFRTKAEMLADRED